MSAQKEVLENQSDPLVSTDIFRDVAGHFASGVTVITTSVDGKPYGTTASAVVSLSMEPPMMLVCLNKSSSTHDRVLESGTFGVNIMAQNQGDTAYAFAKKGTDKFAGIPWTATTDEVPILEGSLASIACRVEETTVGGTHTVFLGKVTHAEAFPGEPLTYYRGTFGRFEHDSVEKAYAALRQHVLQRDTAVGEVLDPQELAKTIMSRPEHVRQAMVRLETEGLLNRATDGSVTVAPLTAKVAQGFFAAQAAIEIGVLDTYLPHVNDDQLAELQAGKTQIEKYLESPDSSDITGYIDVVRNFHRSIISLSPSAQLLGAYEELSTGPLWFSILPEGARIKMLDHANLLKLADAVLAKDTATARDAIRDHLDVVNEIAAEAIEATGGSI